MACNFSCDFDDLSQANCLAIEVSLQFTKLVNKNLIVKDKLASEDERSEQNNPRGLAS